MCSNTVPPGAEGEIRTRATVTGTTPLAGEPLEPLGYFCIAAHIDYLYYYTIKFLSCKVYFSENKNNLMNFLFDSCQLWGFVLQ